MYTLARKILLLTLILFLSYPAQAVVIGGKDWLQVTATTGFSHADIDAVFDRVTGQCDVEGCLLGGIDMTGYVWAFSETVADMINQVTGLSFTYTGIHEAEAIGAPNSLDPLFDLFDPTATAVDSPRSIVGFVKDLHIAGLVHQISAFDNGLIDNDIALIDHNFDPNLRSPGVGGWFYTSITVPEPTSLALLGLGLAGLGFSRKRKAV